MSTRAVLGTAITGAATAPAVFGVTGAAHTAVTLVYSTDGDGVVHGSMKHQTSVTFAYDIIPNYRFTMLICTVDGSGDTTGS